MSTSATAMAVLSASLSSFFSAGGVVGTTTCVHKGPQAVAAQAGQDVCRPTGKLARLDKRGELGRGSSRRDAPEG